MANDEAFGALDFQNDDINLELDSDLSSRLAPAFSQKTSNRPSHDVEKQLNNTNNNSTTSDDKQHNHIDPNNTFPSAKLADNRQAKSESNVEYGPHTETEPQLLQQ
jgi:hypothetical protein